MSWFALYTRPRHEKKVFDSLTGKDLEAFLPVVQEIRQWKDRRKTVETPLFSSYVFVNIELKNRMSALQTHGVVRLIGFGGQPAVIPDWQIDQLQKIISTRQSLQPEEYLKIGDYVEVTDGALTGIRGYLRESRGEARVAVLLDGIYQAASFVVPVNHIRKVERESALADF